MIRLLHHPEQLRIDTTLIIINKEKKEIKVPVVVLIGLNKIKDEKDQYHIYKVTSSMFDREFIIDQSPKKTKEKPWWRFW
jgi:hypothetical protein